MIRLFQHAQGKGQELWRASWIWVFPHLEAHRVAFVAAGILPAVESGVAPGGTRVNSAVYRLWDVWTTSLHRRPVQASETNTLCVRPEARRYSSLPHF
jgi:hypothetical protein